MTDTVGWIFFFGFWLMAVVALVLGITAIRLIGQVNQAREILSRVELNTTGELHAIILQYLRRTQL